MLQRSQRFRHVLREVLDRVPSDQRDDPWCKLAEDLACSRHYNVIHLIYRNKEYEGHYKDFQFGVSTMREHWQSGLDDIRHSLEHPDWLDMPDNDAATRETLRAARTVGCFQIETPAMRATPSVYGNATSSIWPQCLLSRLPKFSTFRNSSPRS